MALIFKIHQHLSLCTNHLCNLESATVIWNPATAFHIQLIERVQHKFIRYIAYKFFNDSTYNIDYNYYERILNLEPLHLRRIINDVKFTAKAFHDIIDGETFLHKYHLHVPSHSSRMKLVFRVGNFKTDLGRFSIMNRLMNNFNKYCNDIDTLTVKSCIKCIVTKAKSKYVIEQLQY